MAATQGKPAGATRSGGGLTGLLVLVVGALVIGLVLPGNGGTADASGRIPAPETAGNALLVPSIGLDAPVRSLSLSSAGVLDPPADTDEVGRWDDSARAGAKRGQTVITGHTVHDGGGVMDELGTLGKGDTVVVRDRGKLVEYRTTRVLTLSKAELADRAQALFGQGRRGGRLVLVTCTDWNGGDYDSNIVVLARPVQRQGFGADQA